MLAEPPVAWPERKTWAEDLVPFTAHFSEETAFRSASSGGRLNPGLSSARTKGTKTAGDIYYSCYNGINPSWCHFYSPFLFYLMDSLALFEGMQLDNDDLFLNYECTVFMPFQQAS
jgi:hypothetical protein